MRLSHQLVDTWLDLGADVNVRDELGYSLLHVAVSDYEAFPAMKTLVNHGVDVNSLTENGFSALMIEVIRQSLSVRYRPNALKWFRIQLLLDAGADLNVQNARGNTALDYAEVMGATEMVEALREAGATSGTPLPEGF